MTRNDEIIALALLGSRASDNFSEGEWLAFTFIFFGAIGMAMNVLVIILNDGMPARAKLNEIPEEEAINTNQSAPQRDCHCSRTGFQFATC